MWPLPLAICWRGDGNGQREGSRTPHMESAEIRLRPTGTGLVLGGAALIGLDVAMPATGAAMLVIMIGVGWIQVGSVGPDPRTVGLGIVLVGLIAAVEASRFGLGVEPLVLGLFAVAIGLIDLILGLLADRYLHRPDLGE